MPLNETHDPQLTSWVGSANVAGCDFPLQNLPFGVFRRSGTGEAYRGGIAIGDQILDLAAVQLLQAFRAASVGELAGAAVAAAAQPQLNALMAEGSAAWSALRLAASRGLRAGSHLRAALESCLLPQAEAQFALPAQIGDYSDFFSSIHHAQNTGALFRPDQPLLPNYRWLPIAYHGRSSSIIVSGEPVVRPWGQSRRGSEPAPRFVPSERLDFELELGAFIGPGNVLGTSIDIAQAEAAVFGLCLLNDWSARDLQAWESQPLGPFLGKSFATTISPWIVTLEALEPYRVPWSRGTDDPPLMSYLDDQALHRRGAIDMELEVWLQTAAMRSAGAAPCRLLRSNYRHAYWCLAQLVAHHTVNGCNLRCGDLLGTGTQSGPDSAEAGSLLELSRAGRSPLSLPNGEQRSFLEDGDTVILRAFCAREGAVRIGFGEAQGRVVPARGRGGASSGQGAQTAETGEADDHG
jgi:fumarylacetoacetase